MFSAVTVAGSVCLDISFVLSAPRSASGREKSKPITNKRPVHSKSLFCKRISDNAGIVDSREKLAIATV
jgi:hypothetical protein